MISRGEDGRLVYRCLLEFADGKLRRVEWDRPYRRIKIPDMSAEGWTREFKRTRENDEQGYRIYREVGR